MTRSVPNPFVAIEGYNCFACAPHNDCGLRLRFMSDGQKIWSDWQPDRRYQGYGGVVHGGIQATLLDEVASWALYALVGLAGLTSELQVQYLKPLHIEGIVRATAFIQEQNRRFVRVSATLLQAEEERARAAVRYRVIPPQMARGRYYFPGKEKFE